MDRGLVVAAVAAVLRRRYYDWVVLFLASLIGSLLVVRGLVPALLSSLASPQGGLLVVALTVLGVYHLRQQAGRSPPHAASAA